MGREIRRVPPNWEHPRKMYISGLGYHPMHDQTFAAAVAEWNEGKRKWDAGEDPDRAKYGNDTDTSYEDWTGECPNEPAYYRPWQDAEATWYQLWETVSEGTPVTPPFATLDELAEHLARCGDEWDQKRGKNGWGRARADAFVKSGGWAPSFVMTNGRVIEGTEAVADAELKKGKS